MLSITYRGHLNFTTILTRFGGEYSFNKENNYTVTPNTWDDLYDIILSNPDPHYREIVFTDDPKSRTNDRRISIDEVPVDEAKALKAEETARNTALFKERMAIVEAYKKHIFDQIADGTLDTYPTTLEMDASAHAEKIMLERHPDIFVKPSVIEVQEEDPPIDRFNEFSIEEVPTEWTIKEEEAEEVVEEVVAHSKKKSRRRRKKLS